jgi:hypothetical protein
MPEHRHDGTPVFLPSSQFFGRGEFPLPLPDLPLPVIGPSDSAFRTFRLQLNRRRVRDTLTEALSAVRGIVVLGDDPLVSYHLNRTGTALEDIVVCQTLVDDLPLTLVSVPKKIWFRPAPATGETSPRQSGKALRDYSPFCIRPT